MNSKELKKYLKEMNAFGKKLAKDKKLAMKFLISAGIYTKFGRLSKHYK